MRSIVSAVHLVLGFLSCYSTGFKLPEARAEDPPVLAAVTNLPATGISSGRATLNALVNPNGTSTDLGFQYGTDPALGPTVSTVAGSAGQSGSLDGLGKA